jgi:hypothetical protein
MPVPDATPVFTEAQDVRIRDLQHAIQSGVAAEHQLGSNDGSPKHLRVGVNIGLLQIGALAQLLIDKGLIGKDEYASALIRNLEIEVATYERRLSETTGKRITLL